MSNEKQRVPQNPNQNQPVENRESLKVPDTKSELDGLKKSIEHQKKLDLLKKSQISNLEGFSEFIPYISLKQNSDKLDSVIKILQSEDGENQLSEYFDKDSITGGGKGFFTDKTYKSFFILFEEILKSEIDKITQKDSSLTQKDSSLTQKDSSLTQKEIEDNQKKKEELEKRSISLNEIITNLAKYDEFNSISNELKYEESELNKHFNNNEIDKATDKLNYIKEKFISKQNFIFETLLSKYKKSGDKKDKESILQIAQSFTSLGVINEERQKQIIQEVFSIEKNFSTEKSLNKSSDESIILDHEKKGDSLVRETKDASITIKDGVITYEQKGVTSPMKLVDYENNDKETKAYFKKEKLGNEIKGLHSDLDKNEFLIKKLSDIWQLDKNKTKIDKSQTNILLGEIGEQIPELRNNLQTIYASGEDSEKQLGKLVGLIYTYTQGGIYSSINENDTLEMKVFACRQKIEDKNHKIRKHILEKEKQIKETEKEFPNLSKESISKKILEKETKMQDTIKFCDEYGLSSLGHIAYIKQVIREYNKNEVERKIPEDIGSSTEFLEAFK
ncbi:hypothetical protein EOM39_05140, partial [Candidatus Gracilibacteria bacterium]|nr:hypothetical protein [Candidatus Gracilibacteria bacterium]